MQADAVMFDMDGLLLDTEKVCLDCFIDTRRHFSLSDSPGIFMNCIGLRGAESDQIIREGLNDQIGLQAFNDAWDARINARLNQKIPMKQGALQLVKILAAKGFPMGVATSTPTQKARAHLERCGILPHLQIVVGGDLVERGKPDPEVYHKVAAHLGFEASNCVAFEDSETGTRAALASGAHTIQVPDLVQPSTDFRESGQVIASDLLAGALEIGLIERADI